MLELVQQKSFQKAMARRDLQIAVAWQMDHFYNHCRANRLRQQQQTYVEAQADAPAQEECMNGS
jgi:hypothetical protein